MSDNEAIVLEVFEAIESRDGEALFALYHDDFELEDAPSLPYASTQGSGKAAMRTQLEQAPERTWIGTWGPLQPTAADRRMEPRVVGTRGDDVVIRYVTRAVAPDGERFESDVLGVYTVRDGKLLRARMHHFDTAAVVAFLDRARQPARPEAA